MLSRSIWTWKDAFTALLKDAQQAFVELKGKRVFSCMPLSCSYGNQCHLSWEYPLTIKEGWEYAVNRALEFIVLMLFYPYYKIRMQTHVYLCTLNRIYLTLAKNVRSFGQLVLKIMFVITALVFNHEKTNINFYVLTACAHKQVVKGM